MMFGYWPLGGVYVRPPDIFHASSSMHEHKDVLHEPRIRPSPNTKPIRTSELGFPVSQAVGNKCVVLCCLLPSMWHPV